MTQTDPQPSSRLSPVAVRVLDRLPDPPRRFDLGDVVDAVLGLVDEPAGEGGGRGQDRRRSPRPGDVLVASEILGELIDEEVVSWGVGPPPGYVVHPEGRPF
jgi:hypothetical protein